MWPVPAETWEQASDEHGFVVDETLPKFVYDRETFDRWILCVKIAERITQRPAETLETRNLAAEFFDSPAPTYDEDEALEEGVLRGADRAVARQIKRLKDGTFAPKGLGSVLTPKPDKPAEKKSPGVITPPHGLPAGLPQPLVEEIVRLGLDRAAKPSQITHDVLGKGNDTTVQKYAPNVPENDTDSTDYLPARQALHEQIARGLLEGKTPEVGPNGERVKPKAVFTAGGTASGKSTLLSVKGYEGENELGLPAVPHTVHVDPDKIKESIPEYDELVQRGDHYAAAAVHRESGDIARLVIDQAIQAGLHVIIEGTGNSKPGEFEDQLEAMDQEGYFLDLIYVDLPVFDAIAGTVQRAKDTFRFVPIESVLRIHKSVSQNFPGVAKLPFVDRIRLYRGIEMSLVAERRGDTDIEVLRHDLFTQFLVKANAA